MIRKPGIRPSELVIMAVHNLEQDRGVTEDDIVIFISAKLGMDPEDVRVRVKPTLARSLALGLVCQDNGRFKMFDIYKKLKPRLGSRLREEPSRSKMRPCLRSVHSRMLRRSSRSKEPFWRKSEMGGLGVLERNVRNEEVKGRCSCCGGKKKTMMSMRYSGEHMCSREVVPGRAYGPDSQWW